MKMNTRQIAALDIGSSKIRIAVAEVNEEMKEPIIRGYGEVPARGISKGLISDVEEATKAIKEAKRIAEKMSGLLIENCYVGITGDHIRGIDTNGRISVSKENTPGLGEPREIIQSDVRKVLEHTKGFPLHSEREILHLFEKEYIIDSQHGIKNPINLNGRRLEVKVHLSTYNVISVSNLTKCINKAGLNIERYVLQSLASSYSTLDKDEKELGTILLDIGYGITDVIVFYKNSVYHTGTVNNAGNSVTNDISYMLKITHENAEQVKKDYGWAEDTIIPKREVIEFKGLAGRNKKDIDNISLAKYIKARMEEILQDAMLEANNADIIEGINPVICLTGGGATVRGCEELADKIFKSSTRLAFPKGFKGFEEELSLPEYSALIGLLKFAIENKPKRIYAFVEKSTNFWQKIKSYIKKIS